MEEIIKKLCEYGYFVKIGLELEFYYQAPIETDETYVAHLLELDNYQFVDEIKKERGLNQFEIVSIASFDSFGLLKEFNDLKERLSHSNCTTNPKPYEDQPGSGLHVNISLHNKEGDNLYGKDNNNENELLLWSINGLLENMKDSMGIFAPDKQSYQRYFESPLSCSHICWGSNNRSVALRIPSYDKNCRIEHRVPSASSDCNKVTYEILKAIASGIEKKKYPTLPKIYSHPGLIHHEFERLG